MLPQFINNYEERIKNFIFQMVDDPIDINNKRIGMKLNYYL